MKVEELELYTLYRCMYIGKSDDIYQNFRLYDFQMLESDNKDYLHEDGGRMYTRSYSKKSVNEILKADPPYDCQFKVFSRKRRLDKKKGHQHEPYYGEYFQTRKFFEDDNPYDGDPLYITYVVFRYPEFKEYFNIVGEIEEHKFDID